MIEAQEQGTVDSKRPDARQTSPWMLPFAPITDMAFAGDLKFPQLQYGIKTRNAKYTCPWCWWCATGVTETPSLLHVRSVTLKPLSGISLNWILTGPTAAAVKGSKTYLVFP